MYEDRLVLLLQVCPGLSKAYMGGRARKLLSDGDMTLEPGPQCPHPSKPPRSQNLDQIGPKYQLPCSFANLHYCSLIQLPSTVRRMFPKHCLWHIESESSLPSLPSARGVLNPRPAAYCHAQCSCLQSDSATTHQFRAHNSGLLKRTPHLYCRLHQARTIHMYPPDAPF